MMQRRTFLCWLVSGAAALPARGLLLHAQAAALPPEGVTTLRAIAGVVLPSQLRAAGHEKVVRDFVQWLASYRSGAERNWGYGRPRKSGTPAIDPARYLAQLRTLEDRARPRGGVFGSLPPEVQRDLVVDAVEQSGVKDLPSAPDGRHVITDVMSFFFNSGAASDLVYRAAIRRTTCRGLAGATERPAAGD